MKLVHELDPRGKRILVRVDWNVTLGKALQIVDDTRIVRTLPTIRYLLEKGAAQVILMSHLGKPQGADPHFSLAPVVRYASRLLHTQITLVPSYDHIPEDRVVMLENLRFHEGEEKNDPSFAGQLARMGDYYVNEAFGESHRESASIVGVPRLLPHYAGLWFAEEVEALLKVRNNPLRPLVVVMGGAKMEDKITLLEFFHKIADVVLLGGGIANTFLASQGKEIGLSLFEPKMTYNAVRLLHSSDGARIVLPTDAVIREENEVFKGSVEDVENIDSIEDIGPTTRAVYAEEIARAKMVIWNGPMGRVEDEECREGTQAIFDALVANSASYRLVGGGDTLASIGKEEHLTTIDHVSTGGGAMLKLLEAGTLPGIEALRHAS